jgi:hypothetical protein
LGWRRWRRSVISCSSTNGAVSFFSCYEIVFVVKMPNFTNVEYGTRVRCGECNADTVPGTVSRQGCT